MSVVLDSSALLAMLRGEPGGEKVASLLDEALMSVVNLAEVAGHYTRNGVSREATIDVLGPLQLAVIDATTDHALDAAVLLPLTRDAGLSLGDRFCLALARAGGHRVLTADRVWAGIDVGVEIEVIR